MAVTLRAKGLSASYGQRTLISGLDLVVVPGDVFGLVGANGSGKTTLLTLLAATGQPTSDDTGDVTSPTNPARTVMSPPRAAFRSTRRTRRWGTSLKSPAECPARRSATCWPAGQGSPRQNVG
ncbi:MAG: ATP-binding cassette domain-containing protein [Geodermatophilaceae bacterium]|nr:ATP-binding cassette domain-containing protein [Geodermatophilaceae bacterium]